MADTSTLYLRLFAVGLAAIALGSLGGLYIGRHHAHGHDFLAQPPTMAVFALLGTVGLYFLVVTVVPTVGTPPAAD